MLQTTFELTLDCRPRHRFLEPIHNVKEGLLTPPIRSRGRETVCFISGNEQRSHAKGMTSSEFRPAPASAPALAARESGGASRDRTGDLKLAKLALSQLSYGPHPATAVVGREGVEPSTSRLSGVRSNHLSYRPRSRLAGLLAAGGVVPAQTALR
jgi:hypothetical protein